MFEKEIIIKAILPKIVLINSLPKKINYFNDKLNIYL
jgi:hypothetical protein